MASWHYSNMVYKVFLFLFLLCGCCPLATSLFIERMGYLGVIFLGNEGIQIIQSTVYKA